jgi:hypothetical protein
MAHLAHRNHVTKDVAPAGGNTVKLPGATKRRSAPSRVIGARFHRTFTPTAGPPVRRVTQFLSRLIRDLILLICEGQR